MLSFFILRERSKPAYTSRYSLVSPHGCVCSGACFQRIKAPTMLSSPLLPPEISAGKRAVSRCDSLGVPPFSDTQAGLFRAYLSPAHAASLEQVGAWMRESGMSTRVDAAGNLIGHYDGLSPDAPILLIGSHLDTVRDAGRYDGALGVMLGVEVVSFFHKQKKRFPFAIDVIGFGDEEGSRFPVAMLTSRAVAGTLEALPSALHDAANTSLHDALRENHLDPARYMKAAMPPGKVLAYLEAHIEQGPVLDTLGEATGIVTAIAAQHRYRVIITGEAGHAGTVPMPLRRDALAAAAEAILVIERTANEGPPDLVATVGQLELEPGAPNVVPGCVRLSIDVRAGSDTVRDQGVAQIRAQLEALAGRRGVSIAIQRQHDLPATPCDPQLTALLARSAQRINGSEPHFLVSGAGHDAMIMAALAPVCMVFIRCHKGISHNPAESVTAADAEKAFEIMVDFIISFSEKNETEQES
jgi:allantoate deiminase